MGKAQTADYGSYDNNVSDYASQQSYDTSFSDGGTPSYGETSGLTGTTNRAGFGSGSTGTASNPDYSDLSAQAQEEINVHENFTNRHETAQNPVTDGMLGSLYDMTEAQIDDARSSRVKASLLGDVPGSIYDRPNRGWGSRVIEQRLAAGIGNEAYADYANEVLDMIREDPLNSEPAPFTKMIVEQANKHTIEQESWILENEAKNLAEDTQNFFNNNMYAGNRLDIQSEYAGDSGAQPNPETGLTYDNWSDD